MAELCESPRVVGHTEGSADTEDAAGLTLMIIMRIMS